MIALGSWRLQVLRPAAGELLVVPHRRRRRLGRRAAAEAPAMPGDHPLACFLSRPIAPAFPLPFRIDRFVYGELLSQAGFGVHV